MSSELPVDHHIAEYRILRQIGRGGMGVVYMAEHTALGRKVALKVLPSEFAEDEGFRDRFHREARLAASLDHPNIVPVYDAGEHEGRLWIAMRFVEGTDLREMLNQQGGLHPLRAVSILGRVASALDAAHGRGLVHRDVKPGNILLEPPSQDNPVEHVYLTDFGLTKRVDVDDGSEEVPQGARQITKTGFFVGTLDYAAPEQFQGKHLDGRTDEYALACVLYECLTGRIPYRGESEAAVMFAHLTEPPPRASALRHGLPMGLDSIVAKGMAKDPEVRYPTCGALIHAARAAVSGAATQPGPGAAPGYAPAQPSHPQTSQPSQPPGQPSQPSYPPPQPSQPSFPPAAPSQPSHAPVQPSFPGPQPSYPGPQPSHAGLQPSYPRTQPSYPEVQPSYPGPPSSPGFPGGGSGGMRKFLPWIVAGVIVAVIVVVVLLVVGGKKNGPGPAASGGTPTQAALANDRIVFVSGRDDNAEIYEMDEDGSNQHDLSNLKSAQDDFPSWSPDFKQVAFASDRDGNQEIYVMNADGTDVRRLTNNTDVDLLPTWAPDGNRLAFVSDREGNTDIYTMNADGSDVRRLTTDPAVESMPAFSHDGARIVFTSKRDGNFEVYVMNVDGSGQTRLTNERGEDSFPAFSPDDGKIAFDSKRDGNFEIYVMNPDGSSQVRLTNNGDSEIVPTWSTDGKEIAFTSDRGGNTDVYTMSADGSNQTRLTTAPQVDFFPTWSSD